MDISQILKLQNWFFFAKETTLLLSVRRWTCIRASEPFFFAASITFLPQKTADILNYAQRQKGYSKKWTMHIFISFKHKWIRDPPFVIGCQTGNSKTRIPDPWNGPINASSQKRLYRSRRKTKTKLKVMFLPG